MNPVNVWQDFLEELFETIGRTGQRMPDGIYK